MMSRVLVLLVVGLAATAAGRQQQVQKAAKEIQYFSAFGETVLRRADLIAIAKVEKVSRGGPGTDVVRLVVREVLKGDRDRKEILVLSSRGDFFADVEILIFVAPYRRGGCSTYLGRVSRTDPDFAAKVGVLKQYLTLETLADDAARAQRVRDIILSNIEGRDEWTRWNALRELEHFVLSYQNLLTASDLGRLSAVESAAAPGSFKKTLADVLKRCSPRDRNTGSGQAD